MGTSFSGIHTASIDGNLPAQTTLTAGRAICGNGIAESWEKITRMITPLFTAAILPSQVGKAQHILQTDGSSLIWMPPPASSAAIYDVASYTSGNLTAGQTILRFVASRPFKIYANFANSSLSATAAPTTVALFVMKVNSTTIGTATIAAGGTAATFPLSAEYSCARGDVITITGPAVADATLNSVVCCLGGYLI